MNIKKLSAAVLAAAILAVAAPVTGVLLDVMSTTASADETEGDWEYKIVNDDYYYNINNAGITKYTGSDSNVVIPDTLGGKTVVDISDNAFQGCTSLKSVTIPISVTSIGKSAFSDCTSLKTIYGVKGSYAQVYADQGGYEFRYISAPQKTVYKSKSNVKGDVDGDGNPTVSDATAVLKYVANLAEFEGNSLNNALLTGGKKPSVKDATQILKIVAEGSVTIKGVKYPIATTTSLNLMSQGITGEDVQKIGKLKNLTDLRLNGNNISDISPLASLTNLTTLYLDANKISDISPLAGLTNLTILYMSANNISDVSSLANLTNLKELNLIRNYISYSDRDWLNAKLPNCSIWYEK